MQEEYPKSILFRDARCSKASRFHLTPFVFILGHEERRETFTLHCIRYGRDVDTDESAHL